MAKLATVKKPAAAPAAGPKLKTGSATAKPAKAPAVAKAKGGNKSTVKEKPAKYAVGAEVVFLGYKDAQENPYFKADDRLVIVAVEKDDDGHPVYSAVKHADYADYQNDPDSVEGDQVVGEEIKKAEKLPVDPYALAVAETDALTQALAEHDNDPLKTAVAMQTEMAKNAILLGGAIGQLYTGQKFRTYGKKGAYEDIVEDGVAKAQSGWDKFCQENLGMGGRKAFGMITIYNSYATLPGVDIEELAADRKIGWVKLEAAARVVTPDNAKEIIDLARKSNVEDFKSSIKTDYVNTDSETRTAGSRIKRTTFKFALFEDMAEGVNYIFAEQRKAMGTDDDAQVFELIVTQWAADHLNEAQQKKFGAARKKRQNELKGQGVDISGLKDRDAKLEGLLAAE
jgi:hypothetical protein